VGSSNKKQRAARALRFEDASTRCPASFSRCASPPETSHRLADAQVLEPDIGERLQSALHFGTVRKKASASDTVSSSTSAIDFLPTHLEHLVAEALAVAVGAAQVHVREELHLDVSKPCSAGRQRPLPELKLKVRRCTCALSRAAHSRRCW